MKTTVILPDDLVRRAKIRAAERGETLSGLMAQALESALGGEAAATGAVREEAKATSYWSTHKPLRLRSRRKDGKVSDSTQIISDDRDGR